MINAQSQKYDGGFPGLTQSRKKKDINKNFAVTPQQPILGEEKAMYQYFSANYITPDNKKKIINSVKDEWEEQEERGSLSILGY